MRSSWGKRNLSTAKQIHLIEVYWVLKNKADCILMGSMDGKAGTCPGDVLALVRESPANRPVGSWEAVKRGMQCLCLTCHSLMFSPLCFRKRKITWHTWQRLVTVIYEQGAPLMSQNKTVPSRRQTLCHLVSRHTNISKNAELNTF